MCSKSLLTVALIIFTTLGTIAQSGGSSFEFIENKGQWDPRVKFRGELSSGGVFLQKDGFRVLLYHPQDLLNTLHAGHGHVSNTNEFRKKTGIKSKNVTVVDENGGIHYKGDKPGIFRSHAFNVQFAGANQDIRIVPEKLIQSYNNYFIGNDPSKWVSHASIYQALVYKNVYPNIDVRYYSENSQLKYDIIVHPGGNINQVTLKYEGVDKLSIRNNELLIKTSVGEVKELYPYSFQFDNVKGRQEVEVKYLLSGTNTVKFDVKNYSKTATLVIDPTLVFSTFTGSSQDNYGFTATPGPDGSFYAGGIVFGAGYPTTTGAFQQSFQGGGGSRPIDIGITKFNANGSQRVYSTYLGGRENEYPHSLFCDPAGNLVVMGRTYSSNYPTTVPLRGPGGLCDLIVTKFNANGTNLIGSMRIGGSGNDGVNIDDQQRSQNLGPNSLIRNYGDDSRSEVMLDNAGNIYVAAQTKSSDFPTVGPFQAATGGGQDGVVLKISPNCDAIMWSSYLGGSDDDGAFVLGLHPNGNVYVAGATSSTNFPGDKTGTIESNYQGGIDGFVTIISNDGSTQIKTTFLGTTSIDIVYGIKFDRNGFPYVMGVSRGTWRLVNATYVNPGSKQFVAKLSQDLSAYLYSTVFGSGASRPNLSPVAFLVDRCENVYISGWGGDILGGNRTYDIEGVAGMPITPDAIKSFTDNKDFYFIVIKKDAASLLYGSFFGQDGGTGEHVDGGTSRFDQQGVIYQSICANCSGGPGVIYPTSPGVVGPRNGALPNGCNLGALKISFNFAGVASTPKSFINGVLDSVGCIPLTVTLRDSIRNAKSYVWTFNDGTPDVTTTNFEVNHTFTNVGTYRVRLIAIDSTTCNIRDTSYITIIARDDNAQLGFTPLKLPPCESLAYQFTNNSIPPAGKPFGAASFTWEFGDGTRVTTGPGPVTHAYAAAGTYRVRLLLRDTNYCNSPDSAMLDIRIAPLVKAQFLTPPAGCVPYEAVFNNTSLGGLTFQWDFGDGTTSTAVNPTHTYNNVGPYIVTLVATDPATCNITDQTQHTITVNPRPTADFSHVPVVPEVNKPTIFTNLSTGGVRYKWLFGDGDSTIKTTMDTVVHQYNATGTYQACLVTFNQYNCTDTICKPVQAEILPLLDVPNAFTPRKFGKNSIVRVEGFGIARMVWRIYNRWGQKVFESNDWRYGWDGTFKGQLQPMDVYAYTLDVQFSDGTKARKQGDITLIR